MLDREATSELSSLVREGAGYDEVYPLGRKPEEDVPGSRLPTPQPRKRTRTRKMRKGRRMRKMMREEKMNMMREMRLTREISPRELR